MGVLEIGVSAKQTKTEEKGLFPPFCGCSRCCLCTAENGDKGTKRARKANFGQFPEMEGRHTLRPHLLHPDLRQPS